MKNIYLIKSDSFFLLNNKIKELTKDIKDISKFDLDEVEIKDIINDGSYYSLFNENKAIIISNTKYFGGKFLYEEETSVLFDYLSKLDENTIIIFICNDISKTKDITKKVLSLGASIIDLTSLKDEEIEDTLKKYFKDNNINIDKKVCDELYKRVGYNIDLLLSEITKISIVSNNITINDINEYSNYEVEDITFDFSNAVISKNFRQAFELLDKLIATGVEIPVLIGVLASAYTTMYIIKDASQSGLSDAQIEELTGYKSGRIYINKKNGRIYTLDEIKDIIIGLSIVDKKIKTGSNPVYVFKEFLLNI
ncbi:MAG: DNA polymerase III subunit delta [Bacilli bacterium]|nr:DNA polymerase III subunit delta [Bacilli bacterium]